MRGPLAGRCIAQLVCIPAADRSPRGEVPAQAAKVVAALASRLRIAPSVRPERILAAMESYYTLVVVAIAETFVPGCREAIGGRDFFPSFPVDLFRELSSAATEFAPIVVDDDPATGADLFQEFYQALFPRQVRHALGEYYTPGWLADLVLDESGWSGEPGRRLLDPTCGSGVFLLKALRAVRTRWEQGGRQLSPTELCRHAAQNVVGFDVNPLAVLTARANYTLAIRDWIEPGFKAPIWRRDVILDPACEEAAFDFVVGNPPWIAWDHLPTGYRQATMPLWQQYGLFTLSANDARHGGAKKDLSLLLTYACADRYLRAGGRLGFVITQTAFQSHAAGDGFRRFRLGESGSPLAVLRVHDMVAMRPFSGAANWTSVLILEKGRPTSYPVPYLKWLPAATRAKRSGQQPDAVRQAYEARPADPTRPGSPWLLVPQGLRGLEKLSGASDYEAHLGANTGGANAVYWLEVLAADPAGVRVRNVAGRAKHTVDSTELVIEPELVYPLIRWGDLDRWRARPSACLLLAQEPATRRGIDESQMQARYPRAYAYLLRFRALLERRAAYRRYQCQGPFYSMYNIGPYTVAPWKVVWRRMDRRLRAAVVGPRPLPGLGVRCAVPQETCVLVAVDSPDEAHYLCALMNSSLATLLARSSSVDGGKGFGTPGMLDHLGLRRFDPARPLHRELAACSAEAHAVVERGQAPGMIEDQIDRLAAELAGLGVGELRRIAEETSTNTERFSSD